MYPLGPELGISSGLAPPIGMDRRFCRGLSEKAGLKRRNDILKYEDLLDIPAFTRYLFAVLTLLIELKSGEFLSRVFTHQAA